MSPSPKLADASDERVFAWALEGREEAYGELMRRYQSPIRTAILRLVRDPDAAEDLTQETFVKAFKALDSHRPESSLPAWIFKIANNVAVNHVKRERRLKHKRLDTVPLDGSSHPSAPRRVAGSATALAARSQATPTPLDARSLAPALASSATPWCARIRATRHPIRACGKNWRKRQNCSPYLWQPPRSPAPSPHR